MSSWLRVSLVSVLAVMLVGAAALYAGSSMPSSSDDLERRGSAAKVLLGQGGCPEGMVASGDSCYHAPGQEEPTFDARDLRSAQSLTTSRFGAPARKLRCYKKGNAVVFLYLYPKGTKNTLPRHRKWLRKAVEEANGIVYRSSRGKRELRVVTARAGGACRAKIRAVAVPRKALVNDVTMRSVLTSRGFNRTDRKYLSFTPMDRLCGVGEIRVDTRKGPTNANNVGPSFARVDRRCWSAETTVHEVMHMLGSVQHSAPYSNKAFHCVDAHDVMCYDDGSGARMMSRCAQLARKAWLDCGRDTYFAVRPKKGTWLARNWNTAASSFLYAGGQALRLPKVVRPALTDISPTSATLAWPKQSQASDYEVHFAGSSRWVTATQLTLANLKPESTYTLTIRARNRLGLGPAVTVQFTTPAKTPPPTDPEEPPSDPEEPVEEQGRLPLVDILTS